MNNFDISALVKAIMLVILLSISIGQFPKLRNFAIHEGLRAITLTDYRPTYFPFTAKH